MAATLLFAPGASAATLVGDYQLQGTRASTGTGPALTDIGATNAFQPDTVMGVSRQVLVFPQHSGVQMIPSVGSSAVPYSVVSTFKLDDVSSYRRILDPSNATADTGIYDYNGEADFYGSVNDIASGFVFNNGGYATVAITSSPPAQTNIYVNGSPVVIAPETLPVIADTLRFFKDNDPPNSSDEDSAGAVSCIRVYNGVLTDAEVAGIGASPTCGTVATPIHKKKCKKHKRKHRAADAKKKKCKKRKKR